MQSALRAIGAIIMAIILIISIIYLAFSIDMIRSSQQYGDFFRPKQGLSVFNIIISLFGIFLAIFCLFIISGARAAFCRIAIIGCLIFTLCAFASLIAALAINLAAIDRTSGVFVNYMNQYTSNVDARNILNTIQTEYECCGNNVWYDWVEMPQRTTTTTTPRSTRSTRTPRTTTNLDTSSSTITLVPETISTSTVSSSTMPGESTQTISSRITRTGRTTTTTATTDSNMDFEDDGGTTTDSSWDVESIVDSESGTNGKTTTEETQMDDGDLDEEYTTSSSTHTSRRHGLFVNNNKKRAAPQKRNIFSIEDPLAAVETPFSVVLPGSCCLNRASQPDKSSSSYCIPNQSLRNGFYRDGCSKMISKYAIAQTFTTAILNSLLIVFALLSIPILNRLYPLPTYRPKIYRNPSLQPHHITDGYTGSITVDGKARDSVSNPHSDYSVYQKNG